MIRGAPTRLLRAGGTALSVALAAATACKKNGPPPSLGEAVSVEQPGGSATRLIDRGSEIPTSATETFTTVHDGERRIAVHVVRGTGRSAGKLRSEGWWIVDGVSGGHAGQPRVLVTFEVDAQGALSVTAREGDRKLRVDKTAAADRTTLVPAPLTEPDDDEDSEDESE